MNDTFGAMLRQRAEYLGFSTEAGLARYLTARGVPCAERGIRAYYRGERIPKNIGRMEAIMDALGIDGADRLVAYQLAARHYEAHYAR